MIQRRTILKASALLGASAIAPAALAQSGRPVKIVVGFLPGGLTDVVARLLAEGLNRQNLGSTFIVESKPGANGRIATAYLKNSSPDGATLMYAAMNVMALAPHIYKKLDYEPLTDFVPVHTANSFGYVLSVGPAVPAQVKTLKEYLAWVKADPTRGNYAGVPGAPQHLLAAYLSKITDTPLTLVPYKGGGPAMAMDIIRGEAPSTIQVTADALQFQGADKLRTLATFTRVRSPFLPNVPTAAEAGVPGLEIDESMGVFAPKGTPPAVVQRLSAAIQQVVSQPSFRTSLATQASVPDNADPEQFARMLKQDHSFWSKVVASTGFTLTE
ncbi:MAG TPA: tripartite tricarboxylate transporter substrate-binding protein [Ramlibacter sp.]|nr:tripartite tricarboxylate transporter substrate-binding protein [Ramlibacter sp.]